MKKIRTLKNAGFLALLFLSALGSLAYAKDSIKMVLFHSPGCKACALVKEEFLPGFISRYQDSIDIKYCDIGEEGCLKKYISAQENFNAKGGIPSVLIGDNFLIGKNAIEANLEKITQYYIGNPYSYRSASLGEEEKDLREVFGRFTLLTVVIAGLVDGINPCAFTVLLFFVSFLTLMGYKKKDLLIIGMSFIAAVYATYLIIGYGLLRGMYELGAYRHIVKFIYLSIAGLCFFLAYLNLKDFLIYKKTGKAEDLKVKLPPIVRNRINAVIARFYRKDKEGRSAAQSNLVLTALIVGFLVSILEAVCTGQVYLPVIVMISRDSLLRLRAVAYLLLYNFMFVAPLILILVLALIGTGSNKLQEFFRARIGLVKIMMFILFLGLGLILILGIGH